MRKVFVPGDDDGLIFQRIDPDRRIIGISQANISNVFGGVPKSEQETRQSWRQLGIDKESHGLTGDEDWVVSFCSSVFETGHDVLTFEIGIVLEDFRI